MLLFLALLVYSCLSLVYSCLSFACSFLSLIAIPFQCLLLYFLVCCCLFLPGVFRSLPVVTCLSFAYCSFTVVDRPCLFLLFNLCRYHLTSLLRPVLFLLLSVYWLLKLFPSLGSCSLSHACCSSSLTYHCRFTCLFFPISANYLFLVCCCLSFVCMCLACCWPAADLAWCCLFPCCSSSFACCYLPLAWCDLCL